MSVGEVIVVGADRSVTIFVYKGVLEMKRDFSLKTLAVVAVIVELLAVVFVIINCIGG